MAIVKARYTRSRNKIKATLRYIVHRPNREGERATRVVFSNWGEELTKEEAYQLIDAQRGMTYFHAKLNFHAFREDRRRDLDLREITQLTVAALEVRLQRSIRFLAVEHNDHTDLRHIHAILLVKLGRGERIGKKDWKLCTKTATKQALLQRSSLDIVRGYQFDRILSQQAFIPSLRMARDRLGRLRRSRSLNLAPSCPNCAYKNQMVRLKNGNYWCPVCERVREQEQGLGL